MSTIHNLKHGGPDNGVKPVYTLGVTSRISGISVYTIQQYIRKGLVLPFKTKSKRNLFSDTDIQHLIRIRQLIEKQGLNIAGIKALYSLIPCWILKSCSEKTRNKCKAFGSPESPCWEASEKSTECGYADCRTCIVYQVSAEFGDIKSLVNVFFCPDLLKYYNHPQHDDEPTSKEKAPMTD